MLESKAVSGSSLGWSNCRVSVCSGLRCLRTISWSQALQGLSEGSPTSNRLPWGFTRGPSARSRDSCVVISSLYQTPRMGVPVTQTFRIKRAMPRYPCILLQKLHRPSLWLHQPWSGYNFPATGGQPWLASRPSRHCLCPAFVCCLSLSAGLSPGTQQGPFPATCSASVASELPSSPQPVPMRAWKSVPGAPAGRSSGLLPEVTSLPLGSKEQPGKQPGARP